MSPFSPGRETSVMLYLFHTSQRCGSVEKSDKVRIMSHSAHRHKPIVILYLVPHFSEVGSVEKSDKLRILPQLFFFIILELAAVCCFCVSGLIHFRHRVMRFTVNEVTWYKFPPLSFLLLGTSCLCRPSGDVPCASEDMACGY